MRDVHATAQHAECDCAYSCIADVSTKDLGLHEIPVHQIHVLHADLHESFSALPGKAHDPASDQANAAVLAGWVYDRFVSTCCKRHELVSQEDPSPFLSASSLSTELSRQL